MSSKHQSTIFYITQDISINIILAAMSTYHVGSMLHLHHHESSRASNIMLALHKSHVMQLLTMFIFLRNNY